MVAFTFTSHIPPMTIWSVHQLQMKTFGLLQVTLRRCTQNWSKRDCVQNTWSVAALCEISLIFFGSWRSLEVLRVVSRLTLMFKIVHGLIDVLKVRFSLRVGVPLDKLYERPSIQELIAHHSSHPHIVSEWNHLPSCIQSAIGLLNNASSLSLNGTLAAMAKVTTMTTTYFLNVIGS